MTDCQAALVTLVTLAIVKRFNTSVMTDRAPVALTLVTLAISKTINS